MDRQEVLALIAQLRIALAAASLNDTEKVISVLTETCNGALDRIGADRWEVLETESGVGDYMTAWLDARLPFQG